MLRHVLPLVMLLVSNVFMTYAWYGHLKYLAAKPVMFAVLISWGIAFLEYCFQVPANRIGSTVYTLPQLKIIQEVITMTVFAAFSYFVMKERLTMNYLYAALCMVGAVFFIFRAAHNELPLRRPLHGRRGVFHFQRKLEKSLIKNSRRTSSNVRRLFCVISSARRSS